MLFTYRGARVGSLRQIDRLNRVPKGTAFRAFKRLEPELREGVDYFVVALDAPVDAAAEELIGVLRANDALYASSRVAVLLAEKTFARVAAIANLRSQ